jgi:hypothetical protein
MTRKDYIEIAKVLNDNLENVSDKMIQDFIQMFKSDNQNFQPVRFENAVKGN